MALSASGYAPSRLMKSWSSAIAVENGVSRQSFEIREACGQGFAQVL